MSGEERVGYMVVREGSEEYYDTEAELGRRYRFSGRTRREGEGGLHTPARRELQGQPEVEGLAGPMWGGIIHGMKRARYETWSVYERLSD